MKLIITEELRYRKRVVEYAIKHKNKTFQTDNGREFTNDPLQAERESIFEAVLKNKGINYRKTRPYSPWQNGIVERSHREDSERFYQRQFNSEEELIAAHQRYVNRGNNIHRKVLQFKSPIEIIKAYKSNQAA